MRVVLDSNVIISASLFDGVPERVVLSTLEDNILVISPYIIDETGCVLTDKFKQSPQEVTLFQQILSQGEMQYFQPYLHVLADEPDNRILETALTGHAEYIVTGDKLLLAQESYQGIKILKPADFLGL